MSFRLEICGGIASGKTTFAALMVGYIQEIIFEDFKENPFWRAFYANPGKYIFETEITFTLLHYHQIKKHFEKRADPTVCDFSFSLDLAYAKIGLNGSKLNAFETILSEVYEELGQPSLMIYLKCDAETELARITKRGRAEEGLIHLDFLDKLNKAVEKEATILQQKCPVLTIDSSLKDFANDNAVKAEMLELIQSHIYEITQTRESESTKR